MKENNNVAKSVKSGAQPKKRSSDKSVDESPGKKAKREETGAPGPLTIGIDLGDKTSRYCVLDGNGEVTKEGSVPTSKKGMLTLFGTLARCRIAMEVGTHSPWVSRLLSQLGHEVIVANAR
jgi:hypothetical protein